MYIYQLVVLCREMLAECSPEEEKFGRGCVVVFIKHSASKQLILRVFGVLLSEHTNEDGVFARRAAQMADS
jgi:hypothetical protein